jgi:Methylamine utilisation protein MauE
MNPVTLTADPVAVGAIVGALALILFAAAWHKLSEPEVFAGALQAYELLPTGAVVPVARLVPFVEAAIGVGVLVPPTRRMALIALAALMLLYAGAIAVNLWRGRRQIDCGCGADAHPLSWGLVVRNAVLAASALAVSGPTSDRGFEWLDGVTLVIGLLAFYGLYLMFDELLRQSGRLSQLRARSSEEVEAK